MGAWPETKANLPSATTTGAKGVAGEVKPRVLSIDSFIKFLRLKFPRRKPFPSFSHDRDLSLPKPDVYIPSGSISPPKRHIPFAFLIDFFLVYSTDTAVDEDSILRVVMRVKHFILMLQPDIAEVDMPLRPIRGRARVVSEGSFCEKDHLAGVFDAEVLVVFLNWLFGGGVQIDPVVAVIDIH